MADCIEQVPFVLVRFGEDDEMSERRTYLPNQDNKAMGFVQLIRPGCGFAGDFARTREVADDTV
jgi:hypothetical protein